MPDTSGPPSLTPFAHYDPDSLCWRTLQGTFDLDSTSSPPTFTVWGIGSRGVLYALPTWAPATDVPASSSLLTTPRATRGGSSTENARTLLPTPTVGDSKSACNATATRHVIPPTGVHGGTTLTDAVRLLPTPKASDGDHGPDYAAAGREETGGDSLVTAIKKLPPSMLLFGE